jgi:hypothetical protein
MFDVHFSFALSASAVNLSLVPATRNRYPVTQHSNNMKSTIQSIIILANRVTGKLAYRPTGNDANSSI